jgi:hypothetical protein
MVSRFGWHAGHCSPRDEQMRGIVANAPRLVEEMFCKSTGVQMLRGIPHARNAGRATWRCAGESINKVTVDRVGDRPEIY